MQSLTVPYFSALPVLSYNAIYTFIHSNRTYGKTWGFKIRAFKRGLKRGKRTIWIRRFKDEAKEAIKKMFPADLRKKAGIVEYNSKKDTGNFKREGNTFFVRRSNGVWTPFIEVVWLSKAGALRSADDPATDTIVFDEYQATPERLKLYRGNEVTDLNDIFFSAKREHIIRCFFLGNNESIVNPYFDYFKIPALAESFEGIKTYRGGSIVVQKINNPVRDSSKDNRERTFNKKLESLFKDTPYGDYIYNSAYKIKKRYKIASKPSSAAFYTQIGFSDDVFAFYADKGKFYVTRESGRFDSTIFVDSAKNKYPDEIILTRATKQWLEGIKNAIIYGLLYYESAETAERARNFEQYILR